MDPHYLGRYAMSGWILAAVLVAGISELGALPDVKALVNSAIASTDSASNLGLPLLAIMSGLFAAIAGIGAPPAVGFLFERVTSLMLWPFGGHMWTYDGVRDFSARFPTQESSFVKGPHVFHIFYYSNADSTLLEWARRRRMQAYASFNAVLALLVGLGILLLLFERTPMRTTIGSLVLSLILLTHGLRELHYHRTVISTWAAAHSGQASSGISPDSGPRDPLLTQADPTHQVQEARGSRSNPMTSE